MSQQSLAVLDRLLRRNGLGWIIDDYAPRAQALPALLEQLDMIAAAYRERVGINVPFSPEALEAEAAENPHKVRAFLQALGSSRSAEMLVMVWRILQGLSIRRAAMNYREREAFSLTVVLSRPGDAQDVLEEYRSADINDAALLRHFGITTINGQPLFDGFYPLRLRDDPALAPVIS